MGLLLIGARMFGGGVVVLTEGPVVGFALLCVAFRVSAVLAGSELLVSLSVLARAASMLRYNPRAAPEAG